MKIRIKEEDLDNSVSKKSNRITEGEGEYVYSVKILYFVFIIQESHFESLCCKSVSDTPIVIRIMRVVLVNCTMLSYLHLMRRYAQKHDKCMKKGLKKVRL